MDGFQARLGALEGSYFRTQEGLAMERHVKRLIDEGKLPQSALDALNSASNSQGGGPSKVALEYRGRPAAEYVYQHTKSKYPVVPDPFTKDYTLGSRVSMGRNRWMVDNVSIFSVADGKKLAATPRRMPTMFEVKRAEAIQRAAMDTPLVGKYRLLPSFTPARAFLWGTILAVWGTAVGAKAACLAMDIKQMDDVSVKFKEAFVPLVEFGTSVSGPLGDVIAIAGSGTTERTSKFAAFGQRLKQKFESH